MYLAFPNEPEVLRLIIGALGARQYRFCSADARRRTTIPDALGELLSPRMACFNAKPAERMKRTERHPSCEASKLLSRG